MTVNVLIISHIGVGEAVKKTVQTMLGGELPVRVAVVPTPWAGDQAAPTEEHARALRDELDTGDGVLVLSDLYGSTPANISAKVAANDATRVVYGLNLAMLLKIMNYCDIGLGLNEIAEKACAGGRDGVRME